MDMAEIVIEVVGWLGAGLILGGYVLLSFGKLEARSYGYQAMNVAGATGFMINSGYHGALPNAVLNIIWIAVGLITLWGVWRMRSSGTEPS